MHDYCCVPPTESTFPVCTSYWSSGLKEATDPSAPRLYSASHSVIVTTSCAVCTNLHHGKALTSNTLILFMLSLLKSLHRSSLSYCGAPKTVSWQTCPPRFCRTCMWMHHHCSGCCTRTLTAPKPPRRCREWSRLRPCQTLLLRRRLTSSRFAAAQNYIYIVLYTYYIYVIIIYVSQYNKYNNIYIILLYLLYIVGCQAVQAVPVTVGSETTVCQYSTCVGA